MARYTAYDELDASSTKKPVKRRPRRASLLGLLGVLVGIVAIALTQRDSIKPWLDSHGVPHTDYLNVIGNYFVDPYHIAAAGAGLAVLALLLRGMTGRTRGGWPVLALLLSGTAAGIWWYQTTPDTNQAHGWVRVNVVDRVDRWVHPPATPAAPQPSDVTVSTPTTNSPSTAPSTSTPAESESPPTVTKPAQRPVDKPNKVFDGL